ncbi:MAG: hypothetical protein RLY93_14985 [Sumerlaeia bacterium]
MSTTNSPASEFPPDPTSTVFQPQAPPPSNVRELFWKSTAEALRQNVFYPISALLIIVGCYKIMAATTFENQDPGPTLQAMSILHLYELLVIATAIAIVRRFRKLSDAYVLFQIEVLLLLDPTFFANALLTFERGDTLRWAVFCFLAAPLKLFILMMLVKLRLSPRAFLGFVMAAAFIYLLPESLNRGREFPRVEYYYAIGWIPLLYMLAMPALTGVLKIGDGRPDYATRAQQWWLPRWIALVPFALMIAHHVESAKIHDIYFYALYVAPALLGLGWFLVNTARDREGLAGRVFALDALAVGALIVSGGPYDVTGKMSSHSALAAPPVLAGSLPLIACGAAVCVTYIAGWLRWRETLFLKRLAVLGGLAVVGGLYTTGAAGFTWAVVIDALERVFLWVVGHPLALVWGVWVLWLAVAAFRQTFWAWTGAAWLTVFLAGSWLPGPYRTHIPELMQAALAIYLLMDLFVFQDRPDAERWCGAWVLAGLGLWQAAAHPGWVGGLFLAAEIAGFLVIGFWRHEMALKTAGAAQALLVAGWGTWRLVREVPASLLMVAAALAVFAVAVVVTWRKERLVAWAEGRLAPHDLEAER